MAQMNLDNIDYNNPDHFADLMGFDARFAVFKSPETVRKEARETSQIIHDTYNTLHAIVARHEETIQDRWMKKSGKQRRKILLECWLGMSPVHRPDFEAYRKEKEEQRSQGTKYRESFMWPYINQEDLSKPKNFLLLLHARARHHPSHFAAADDRAIRLGVVTGAILRVFLNGHVMILNGATGPDKYGELITWDDHPDAFEWMHTQKQFGPGDGLIVLEIQERILRFLLDCSRFILHDIPADTLASGIYPVQPEPHVKTGVKAKSFESLVVTATELPYRLPTRIDFGRMELLLEAKVSATRDHIWALREDPDYFGSWMADMKEHRQEVLKDTMGNIHPAFHLGGGTMVKARIIANLVVEAYGELEIFTELCRQAKELHLLYNQCAAQLSPTEDLPGDFLDRLLTFRHYLRQAVRGPLKMLRHNVVASPQIRKFFVREPPANATTSHITVMTRPGIKLTEVEGHLIWLLRTLWEDDHTLFLADMPLVLDELERLLQANPQAAALVSARISEIIGEASIISQCLSQINQYQPWERGFDTAEVGKKQGIQQGFAVWAQPLSYICEGIRDRHFVPIAELGDVSNRRFFYPTERRRTKENVETLRRAEQNLDEFWRAVDKIVDVRCGHLRGTIVRALLSEKRTLRRIPEWVDTCSSGSATGKQNQQQQRHATSGDVKSLYKPLSTLYFNTGQIAGRADDASTTPKDKKKTSGEPAPIETSSLPPPAATIRVDSRALKVFRTLFFDPGVTSSPAVVCWQDFVYAMTSTGLFSAEKLYGSVWQFQRLDTKTPTGIQFHQPHLQGKILFAVARSMGRRLNRSFGWIGTSFVLEENE
ncbi:hypothetical protein B0H67DRAFT_595155 [Lasiosphaeris hirsuta]|uniref:Uncharacterized protein n=1 Tax=Lasiosphaeris hirsuta TaxID=260670 RepID=A0AA39ZSH9_9PEZI|nr:hypothetical protein B0H67DRAFT_595155 [Lasiosphaeris hirsuta]